MAGLQRSDHTFRRSGSSGMVWDERFLSGDQPSQTKKEDERELRPSKSVGSNGMPGHERKGSRQTPYRTCIVAPAFDPPSPDVSGCLLCGVLGKPKSSKPSKSRRH